MQSLKLKSLAIAFMSFIGIYPEAPSQAQNITIATGEFEVKMIPQKDEVDVGRFILDKNYSGVLLGSGVGQMLSKRTAVDGSAGYVALEIFTGTVDGKSGTFAMQHIGVMSGGALSLDINVIPDSGTDQLVGLVGKMKISIENNIHSYEFEYSLP